MDSFFALPARPDGRRVEHFRRKRGPRVALALLLTTVVLGLTVNIAGADGRVVTGNPNCTLIPGTSELRVDPAQSGTFTDGTLTVMVTVRNRTTDDPQHPGNQTGDQVFDFTASGGTVLGVVVKGGPNANLYDYRPVGVTSGTGLHAPLGPGNKFAGLSHLSFCYIVKANPTIVTQVSSASITIGDPVSDTATLSGGSSPTGTITFNAFGPNDATCSGTAAFTNTVTVSGNGNYSSGSFTPTAVGTYRWIASYSGDGANNAATTACNDPNETVVVNKARPGIVTQVSSASITIGGSVSDTATLSGGFNPTGTITFNAYGPNDADCSGAAAFTDTVTVSGNGNYSSGSFTPTAVGTYRWIANYSGDANNEVATTACNDPNESVEVTKNQPRLGTAPELLPNDKATLSGLVNPSGGTITFELFLNADCSGTAAYTEPAQTVNANGDYFTSNSTVKVTGDRTISWIVTYSGDASNQATSSGCTDEQVVMDFTPLSS